MTELKARNKLATATPQIIEGYQNGATLRQLANLHNVSSGTVRNCLIANGIKLRTRGRRRQNSMSQEETNGSYK